MLERWEEAHPFPLNYGGVLRAWERGGEKNQGKFLFAQKGKKSGGASELDLISGAHFRDTHSHTQIPALNCSRENKRGAPLS